MTDRRTFLTAALITPVAIAAPAIAQGQQSGWRQIVAEYQASRRAYEAHPCGTTLDDHPMHEKWEAEGEMLLEMSDRALDRVMEFPVADNAMLLEKMQIAVKEFGGDNFMNIIMDDTARLALMGRA